MILALSDIGSSVQPERLGVLSADEVLYDFDGPRIFTSQMPEIGSVLAYCLQEDTTGPAFLVVPTDARTVKALKSGAASVHDALQQTLVWVAFLSFAGEVLKVRRTTFDEVPKELLPKPFAMLRSDLEPLLRIRAVNAENTASDIPISVIRAVLDGANGALRRLLGAVTLEEESSGRPPEKVRRFYDLPAQRIAFASFEISLRAPQVAADDQFAAGQLINAREILNKGIAWSEDESQNDADPLLPVALDVLSRLAPPQSGWITQTEIGGVLVGNFSRPRILTRDAATRIRRALKTLNAQPDEELVIGYVGEVDRDKQSLTVRDSAGATLRKCWFEDALLDSAIQALQTNERVGVAVRNYGKRSEVSLIAPAPFPAATSNPPE